MKKHTSYLRPQGNQDSAKVAMVELLYDLVFVFAITQLSHTLLDELSWKNAAQVSTMLVAVWSVWLYTSWVTNWLDPDRFPVRLFLFGMMLVGLVMSASIPKAFVEYGQTFAGTYVSMQLARSGFFAWALRHERENFARNARRLFAWEVFKGVIWFIGGWADPDTRLVCWSTAVALGLISPWTGFWVPGMGRSGVADWHVNGRHVAERCGLFVIIAIGESLLITGATFSDVVWDAHTRWAFASAAVGSLSLWWIYFDRGAEHAAHVISRSKNPGETARAAYTVIHLLIVAGIIVCAVADELILTRPTQATADAITVILLGPALFLLGTALFKWVVYERKWPPLSHFLGLVLLMTLVPPATLHWLSLLDLGIATTSVLLFVLVWESVALNAKSRY